MLLTGDTGRYLVRVAAVNVPAVNMTTGSRFAIAMTPAHRRLPPSVVACVAVVEDDAELRDEILVPGLREFGFDVVGLESVEALYRHILSSPCELIVLDVGLPNEDGLSALAHLRAAKGMELGIVMLTGLADGSDRVRGLAGGADAYLAKPVEIDVLAATLHSLLRRMRNASPASGSEHGESPVTSSWHLDEAGWCLLAPDGRQVPLTQSERRLLATLLASAGAAVSREELVSSLTEDTVSFDHHRLEMIIHRLRRKVEDRLGRPLPLRSVRGMGYVFTMVE